MNKIEKLLQDYNNSKPEWPYPKLFAELKNIGVTSYETSVAQYSRKFSTGSDTWIEYKVENFQPLEINSILSSEALEKTLKRRQHEEITYKEFIDEVAKCGVAFFVADMSAQTVTYYDISKRKNYVQQIPQIT